MHLLVHIDSELASQADSVLEPPVHKTVGPEWSAGVSKLLSTTSNTNLGEDGLDKVTWVWNSSGWLADLGHGRGNEVRDDKLDINALWLHLRSEGGRPLLEESLGAGVGSEKWSWKKTAEGTHGEDETALALGHAWCNDAGDLKGTHAVDGDDITHLLLWSEGEWNWV